MNFLKLTLAISMALPAVALARPEIVDLDLREQEYNSQQGETTVPLRQLIDRHYSGRVDLSDYNLQAVEVLAKSKQGQAQMYLLVGSQASATQRIAGNPRDYNQRRQGYANYIFRSPGRDDRGVWQLRINGNVKIDRIRVRLNYERPNNPPNRGERIRIGSVEAGSPFGWDSDTVNNSVGGRFYGLELNLSRGSGLEIRDVRVTCRDGRVCFSQAVGRDLGDRRPLRFDFRAALDVKSVTVRAKPQGISIPSPKADVILIR
jgi:hypothetical protein